MLDFKLIVFLFVTQVVFVVLFRVIPDSEPVPEPEPVLVEPEQIETVIDRAIEDNTRQITHHHYATMMDDFVRDLNRRNQAYPVEYPR